MGTCTAVVGLQWGDEGKGKIVDRLAPEHDAVVRYNGGANAGHTVVANGKKIALHLVPSGVLHEGVLGVIGNGVVVDPVGLLGEISALAGADVDAGGLVISDRAHVVTRYHKLEDAARERLLSEGDGSAIGTTKRGIGPAYAEKVQRGAAVRVGDLVRPALLREKLTRAERMLSAVRPHCEGDWPSVDEVYAELSEAGEKLQPRIRDTVDLLHTMLADGKSLLFEGANATLLDVDHGTYPFVTSSSCSVHGIGPGTGVPARAVSRVVGIMKAYSTRVGEGPMPSEIEGDEAHRIRERGREYGTTTGRPRRVGWLDLVAARYAVRLNGVDEIVMTLLDVLSGFERIGVCGAYEGADGSRTQTFVPDGHGLGEMRADFELVDGFSEDITGVRDFDELPAAARGYVERVEAFVGARIRVVSVGPDREQVILR